MVIKSGILRDMVAF